MFQTKRDLALAQLRDAIIDGSLKAGTRLILEDLAQHYELSLTPIREAMPVLEREGFIIQLPHKGAMVAHMDPDEIKELYTIRRAMEGLAAEHAVAKVTDTDLALMADLAERLERSEGATPQFLALDRQFHHTLYQAAGSQRWVKSIETYWRRSTRYMLASSTAQDAIRVIHEDHRNILAAVRNRDVQMTVQLVRTHLERAEQRLLKEWV